MRLNIDTPTPEMGEEESAKLDRDNVAALRTTINKTGVNQLLLVKTLVATNFLSATQTNLLNFVGVVTSSGGFFNITFKTSVQTLVGAGITFFLYIDDVLAVNLKDMALQAGDGSVVATALLKWDGLLGAGRHTITVQALSGANAVISYGDSPSVLQATETLL